jgi:hypothetical protein
MYEITSKRKAHISGLSPKCRVKRSYEFDEKGKGTEL